MKNEANFTTNAIVSRIYRNPLFRIKGIRFD